MSLFTKAQNSPYRFKSLTVNDGLSQNSIWQILRDKNGFLWIGTADGLNRYDGYEIKTYKHNFNDTNSIGGNNITFLFEDKYGHLWIGNESGLDVFDPVKNTFKHPFVFPFFSPNNHHCYSIFDEPDGEHFWVYPKGFGIKRYQTRTCTLALNTKFVNAFNFKKFGELSLAKRIKERGYMLFDKGNILEYNFNTHVQKVHHINQISSFDFSVQNGNLYYIKNKFFESFNLTTGEIKKIAAVPQINFCRGIYLVQKNWILISESGYATLDTTTHQIKYFESFDPEKKQTYNRISSFLFDNENILWFGTDGKGLFYTSLHSNKFKTYKSPHDDENMVKGICVLPGNKLVTAVYKLGLVVYNLDDFSCRRINSKTAFPNSQTQHFPAICVANNNEVWVSKVQNLRVDLFLVDVNNGKGTDYTKLISTPSYSKKTGDYYPNLCLQNDKVYALRYNAVFDIYHQSKKYNSSLIFNDEGVTNSYLYISNNKKYVITGYSKGTYVRKFNDKNFKLKLQQDGLELTKCINEDLSGNYYVATTSGIYVYDSIFKLIEHYTTSNQLVDNFVYGILRDDDGNMWFSHNKGISCYFVKNKKFKHYNVSDGLQSNEFNTGAFYKATNGQLFFGGVNGVNAFYPRDIIDNPNKPHVYISSIKLFDEPYKSDTDYWMKKNISLPYFQNTLSFDFIATEMTNSEKNQYAYMMEGVDENWINNGNKRFARYANLPHGNYILKIKASNSDGVWNETPTVLYINITPPFWKTNWFYFILFFVVSGFVGSIVLYIINRQKLKLKRELEIQHKLEIERLRISRDLHDHVGAQLSYLITNIDWMLEHPDLVNANESNKRLTTLSDTGKQAILTLRQTIWALNNKELSVEEFADRFKQFAIKMLEFDKNIHIHFNEKIDDKNMLSPGVALNLFRVCQEAFNNCLKHSKCTQIDIHFESNKNALFIFEIKDNGVGFDVLNGEKNGHYGLQNMKARAKESDAELQFQSTINEGTKIRLTYMHS